VSTATGIRWPESGAGWKRLNAGYQGYVRVDTSRMLTLFCIGSVNQFNYGIPIQLVKPISPVGRSTSTGWLHDVTVNQSEFGYACRTRLKSWGSRYLPRLLWFRAWYGLRMTCMFWISRQTFLTTPLNRAWNSLPSAVRAAPSLITFRRELKTFLYRLNKLLSTAEST